MRYFNFFYISVIAIGILLYFLLQNQNPETIAFYGFAETNATEINYNHSVMVDSIHVTEGSLVKAGQKLMSISRITSKEQLQDQVFQIDELRAKEAIWKNEMNNDLKLANAQKLSKVNAIQSQIEALQKELAHKKSLVDGLSTIKTEAADYQPLENKINSLIKEKEMLAAQYDQELDNITNETAMGSNPYSIQIKRLKAEMQFDEDQKIRNISVYAPFDGLIGDIMCKEAEHIPSYSTLLVFYEPNPTLIKGFIHEDLTLAVHINDPFTVKSLKDDTIAYEGRVIGLGSRIVEIPNRLRKFPDLKTYGREISIAIKRENSFLQKEKVGLELLKLSSN